MANKEITLLDVIDRAQLQSLQDAFAKATGMAALATDKNGPVTQLSCPTDFCMNYTRKSSVGCERCNLCDLKGGEQASKTGRPAVYYCHGGLVDFASPIIVNGEQIGSLIGGQVLTEEPDLDKFRAIAKEIDVDPDEYVEAVKKVPIVSEEKVNNAAELLFKMAQALSQVGYEKYSITEEHKNTDAMFDEVQDDYKDINANVEEVNTTIAALSAEFDLLREKAAESAKAVAQTDSILKYIQNVATQMTLLGFNASIVRQSTSARQAQASTSSHRKCVSSQNRHPTRRAVLKMYSAVFVLQFLQSTRKSQLQSARSKPTLLQ